MVIITGHMIGGIAAGINAGAANGNIWCRVDHPFGVNDNCVVIICGGDIGNVRYLLCVTGPGSVIIIFRRGDCGSIIWCGTDHSICAYVNGLSIICDRDIGAVGYNLCDAGLRLVIITVVIVLA